MSTFADSLRQARLRKLHNSWCELAEHLDRIDSPIGILFAAQGVNITWPLLTASPVSISGKPRNSDLTWNYLVREHAPVQRHRDYYGRSTCPFDVLPFTRMGRQPEAVVEFSYRVRKGDESRVVTVERLTGEDFRQFHLCFFRRSVTVDSEGFDQVLDLARQSAIEFLESESVTSWFEQLLVDRLQQCQLVHAPGLEIGVPPAKAKKWRRPESRDHLGDEWVGPFAVIAFRSNVAVESARKFEELAYKIADSTKLELVWENLNDRQRNSIQATYELGAVSVETRATTAQIAGRAEGPNVPPEGFKQPLASLVSEGVLRSKQGARGGFWLTPLGVSLATLNTQ